MADPIFAQGALPLTGLSIKPESAVDIDHDGDLDIFSNDGDGNTLFSRNTGTVRNPVFAPPQTNPFGLVNMGFEAKATFIDIDGDGDMDAFIGQYNGTIQFFKNIGTSTTPRFAIPQANPFGLTSIADYAANPTFVDIDGDGDMDVFVGSYRGNTSFFKNIGTAQAPAFAASIINPFGLSDSINSTSSSFVDIDGDSDLDVFAGWDSYYGDGIWFYRNIGTSQNPKFYSVGSHPFGLDMEMGSTTFADIDGDGDLDELIKPLENKGEGFSPFFESWGTSLPQVDYSMDPTFVDIDGDGDLDAFVGLDYSYSQKNEEGSILFFKNTGTVQHGIFTNIPLVNPFGLTDAGEFASPAFVDIDNDKDLDAFIGDAAGNTNFYLNAGTAKNPIFSLSQNNPFGLNNAGYDARPSFVDIDNDQDMDVFINHLFFRNTGTSSNPVFSAPQTDAFGLNAFAPPDFIDVDRDGDLDAFTNSSFWKNIGAANNPLFTFEISAPFGIPAGDGRHSFFSLDTLADIDGDGDLDAYVTGEYSDGSYSNFDAGFYINNNAPNVSNLTVAEKYTKGTPLNLQNIVVSDPDSAAITATLKLSNSTVGSLSTGASGTVTSTYNAANGTWSASGTLANVNALLASVIFIPAANFTGNFSVDASISDGTAAALTATKSFTSSAGSFLTATAVNNVLTGTASNNDTITYAAAASAVTVNLNLTTQQNTGGSGLDTLSKVENLIGSAFNDNLSGNTANNVLVGNAGNDTLAGWSGADTMLGGPGNDTYLVENAGDVVFEKANEGVDTVSSRLTYLLPANIENLVLTDTSAANGTGNALNNIITGNNAANQLNGGAGNDTLNGGLGSNRLTGGVGNDFFTFTTKGHVDTIFDFNVANDTIQLDNAVFPALGAVANILPAAQFRVGIKALDTNDHIIYNSATGALLYDADGTGAAAAQQIATLSIGLAMTNTDIAVI
ncbi:MAG: VCBS repeat-containing protein [Nitrosomonas sp.]|nr:VCBS repeat-containing protein [Nitrosomonas sp.]